MCVCVYTTIHTTAAKYKRSVSQIGHSWLELRARTTTTPALLTAVDVLFSLSVGWVVLYIFSRVPDKRTNTNFCVKLYFISLVSFGVSVFSCVCVCLFFHSTVISIANPTTFARSTTTTKLVWYLLYNISQENNNKFFNEIVLSRPNGIDRRPDWNRFHFRRQHTNATWIISITTKSRGKI